MRLPRSLVCAALVGLAACAPERLTQPATADRLAATGPRADVASGTDPQFLEPAAGAPSIANPVVQFWAKRGVDRTAEMYYHASPGARDSVTFFSLRLRAKSLARRPDGSAIADGDSVLITLTLVDAEHGIVDCQPSGLRFDPKNPVRLKVSFAETNDDVNGDGTVDAVDASLTRTFAVWRRESSTDPWLHLLSNVSTSAHEVEADIGGFTSYAIAW